MKTYTTMKQKLESLWDRISYLKSDFCGDKMYKVTDEEFDSISLKLSDMCNDIKYITDLITALEDGLEK